MLQVVPEDAEIPNDRQFERMIQFIEEGDVSSHLLRIQLQQNGTPRLQIRKEIEQLKHIRKRELQKGERG
jgi:hypothetical protein